MPVVAPGDDSIADAELPVGDHHPFVGESPVAGKELSGVIVEDLARGVVAAIITV